MYTRNDYKRCTQYRKNKEKMIEEKSTYKILYVKIKKTTQKLR